MAALARSYEGARVGRRTEGWVVAGTSANAEISTALLRLRDRSRDLVRNNPYGAKAVSAVVSNLVGTGILPQADGDGGIKLIDESLLCGSDEAILRVVLVDDETEAVRDVVRCSSSHRRCALPASAHRRGRSAPADGYAAPSMSKHKRLDAPTTKLRRRSLNPGEIIDPPLQ